MNKHERVQQYVDTFEGWRTPDHLTDCLTVLYKCLISERYAAANVLHFCLCVMHGYICVTKENGNDKN